MNYNLISRRIVDRSIKYQRYGRKFAEYRVITPGINETVLTHYVLRRAPKARVLFDHTMLSQTRMVIFFDK